MTYKPTSKSLCYTLNNTGALGNHTHYSPTWEIIVQIVHTISCNFQKSYSALPHMINIKIASTIISQIGLECDMCD